MNRGPISDVRLLSLAMSGFLIAGVHVSAPCQAEIALSLFMGQQATETGDLHYKDNSIDTNLRFKNIRWQERSFEDPYFYGARAAYWFDDAPNWGVSLDFTHAKTYASDGETVRVKGVRRGVPVNGREPFYQTIDSFNFSHGLNMLTINGMHRWFLGGVRDESLLGRLQIYTGFGAGLSIPHVEANIKGVYTEEYQFAAGPVVNGMLGMNFDFTSYLSGFLEYKLSYANTDADLKGKATVNAESVNHQFIFGLTTSFNL